MLSAHLMESELFGHERGRSPGPKARAPAASNWPTAARSCSTKSPRSTWALQAKLLRVLQERTFEKVGSSVTRDVDVRVLATTNRDLRQEVALDDSAKTCIIGWRSCRWRFRRLRDAAKTCRELAEHFLGRAARRLASRALHADIRRASSC